MNIWQVICTAMHALLSSVKMIQQFDWYKITTRVALQPFVRAQQRGWHIALFLFVVLGNNAQKHQRMMKGGQQIIIQLQ